MRKTFTPRDNSGALPYSLMYYSSFMGDLKGASEVSPLFIKGQMPKIGRAIHHVEPEGVTIKYDCIEHSTGQIGVRLDYHGSIKNISKLRARIRKLEESWATDC